MIINKSFPFTDAFLSNREKSFCDSLERVIHISKNDDILLQMFHNETSALYIPNRICETINNILHDERELYIQRIIKTIYCLEAALGKPLLKQIIEFGKLILNHTDQYNIQENESVSAIKSHLLNLLSQLTESSFSSSKSNIQKQKEKLNISSETSNQSSSKIIYSNNIKTVADETKKKITSLQNEYLLYIKEISRSVLQHIKYFQDHAKNLQEKSENFSTTTKESYSQQRPKTKSDSIIGNQNKSYTNIINHEDNITQSEPEVQKQNISNLQKKIGILNKEKDEREGDIIFLQATITEKELEIDQVKNERNYYKQLADENIRLSDSKIQQFQNLQHSFKNKMKELVKQNNEMKEDLNESQQSLNEKNNQIENLEKKLELAQSQYSQLSDNLHQTKSLLESETSSRIELQNQVSDLQEQLAQHNSQTQDSTEVFENSFSQENGQNESIHNNSNQSQSFYNSLLEQNEQTTKELNDTKAKLASAENSKKQIKQHLSQLSETTNRLLSENESLRELVNSLSKSSKNQVDFGVQQYNHMAIKLKDSNEKVEKLSHLLYEIKHQIIKCKKIEDLPKYVEIIISQVNTLQKANDKAQKDFQRIYSLTNKGSYVELLSYLESIQNLFQDISIVELENLKETSQELCDQCKVVNLSQILSSILEIQRLTKFGNFDDIIKFIKEKSKLSESEIQEKCLNYEHMLTTISKNLSSVSYDKIIPSISKLKNIIQCQQKIFDQIYSVLNHSNPTQKDYNPSSLVPVIKDIIEHSSENDSFISMLCKACNSENPDELFDVITEKFCAHNPYVFQNDVTKK